MLVYIIIGVLLYKWFYYEAFENVNVSDEVIRHIESYPDTSLDIFTDKEFKPECCPSLYTKSSGCMCDNETNHNLLVMRGGNRMLKDTYAKPVNSPWLIGPMCPQSL